MDFSTVTVGEIAAAEPVSIKIFKELGIDFCCDGKVRLPVALRWKEISPEQFAQRLEALKAEEHGAEAVNFLDMAPAALAEYIVAAHHAYLKRILPETYALFLKVLRVHGANHPELYEVFKLFGALKTDLDQHLIREEEILFPKLADRGGAELDSLAAEILEEHENVGALLDKIRATNRDYALPPDVCRSYTNLYQTMREIEDDIHQHIHLENNILLKGLI